MSGNKEKKDKIRWPDRIRHIVEAMGHAENFVRGMTYGDFSANLMAVYAVLRCFQVIGEATKKVPDDVRSIYKAVPWREMAGLRDKVVHDYDDLDVETIWKVIQNDFPGLKTELKKIHLSEKDA
jgi:uncharacterized protein with HEPN domain